MGRAAGRLGLIAGGGALPLAIAARCEAEGRPVFIVRLVSFADPHLVRYPGIEAGMAEIGRVLSALKSAECEAVCFAGTVSRPDFKALKPDLKGATLLPGIIAAATRGDDALLRKILSVFEAEGYAIEGADDILGGETLPAGALGRVAPDKGQLADLRKALHVAEKAGELDIGQGAVVCDGLVLAVEAQEGTDAMLARVGGTAGGPARDKRRSERSVGQSPQADPGPAGGHAGDRCANPGNGGRGRAGRGRRGR